MKQVTRYQIDREKYGVPWFTDWFRKILGEKRMTIEHLSEITGIAQTTLMYYRTGVRNPTLKNFLAVVEALGMTIEIK